MQNTLLLSQVWPGSKIGRFVTATKHPQLDAFAILWTKHPFLDDLLTFSSIGDCNVLKTSLFVQSIFG